ncbi:hypothetical protein BDY17DRAFT_301069 [Neohortaea acidophila]|uniref:Uncharacterized protein n=1 Tax=Neohortaea acidophila TaxID=245834 RepID=A0A6A6PMH6_9PEZI|nr:uncharacterized protein BDY17DRAFT_301069 [Neohortaea acidophila]KAF2481308.1 hypothetical protein BDY17DRAFT_301069 [Neohortaea acidophila]
MEDVPLAKAWTIARGLEVASVTSFPVLSVVENIASAASRSMTCSPGLPGFEDSDARVVASIAFRGRCRAMSPDSAS